MPLKQYLLIFVYPGFALILLRSFAEHREHQEPKGRTAIIEAEVPTGLALPLQQLPCTESLFIQLSLVPSSLAVP